MGGRVQGKLSEGSPWRAFGYFRRAAKAPCAGARNTRAQTPVTSAYNLSGIRLA